jgi:hypothetical protein
LSQEGGEEAKDEFLLGEADFEKAGFHRRGMTAIEKTYDRLRDRAATVNQAFGIPEAVPGRTFFVFFVVTLGALTALRARLPIKPTLVIWTSLVVALISAFSLCSAELLQALADVMLKSRLTL